MIKGFKGIGILLAATACLGVINMPGAGKFQEAQLSQARVLAAQKEKDASLAALFKEKDIPYPGIKGLFIQVFKEDGDLEVWALQPSSKKYILVKRYDICRASGRPGPKRMEGDLQVPEGFYRLVNFNPQSSYHLSLSINYPNASDRILSNKARPGGDICIHGSCVTIGCIPLTDDKIKEVYWMAVLARDNGQRDIPVHIFPARYGGDKMPALQEMYKNDKEMLKFWADLEKGYNWFEKEKQVPAMRVDGNGRYLLP